MKLKHLIDSFLQAIYPPACIFCGAEISVGDFCCEACKQNVRVNTTIRKMPLATGVTLQCRALYRYDGAVRRAILNLKFYDRKEVGAVLGKRMAEDPAISKIASRVDVITAVPLSKKRYASRGYNQAALIAQALAEQCGVRYVEILEKYRENAEQSTLDKQDREENVRNVYRIAKGMQFHGKEVLLIDDIVTTGATLRACAEVLYDAGASCVFAATFAHADLL